MAKIKNKRTYSDNPEYLKRLADELEFLGRPFTLDLKTGTLTQIARMPRKKKRSKKAKKEARNKRAESASRNLR